MLSFLIWLPAAAGLIGALLPRRTGRRDPSGPLTLLAALASLGLAIALIVDYHPGSAQLAHVTDVVWISELGIHYKLGVDGLNLFLVGMATLLFAVALFACNRREWQGSPLFFFQLGLAPSGVLGAFLAQDLALFVVFFDLMLVPFYFLIGIWGGTNRVAATTKLVIYTLVAPPLRVAAAIATAVLVSQQTGHHISFVLSDLQQSPLLGQGSPEWIFLCFAAAFLV